VGTGDVGTRECGDFKPTDAAQCLQW
jgi:hypothetical protein